MGAVVCTQAVAATRMESLQRSRMGSGQASVAGSMLLRAATMGPGQCLSAESFLGDGRANFSIQYQMGTTAFGGILSASHAHDKYFERQMPPVRQPHPFIRSGQCLDRSPHTFYMAVRCVH